MYVTQFNICRLYQWLSCLLSERKVQHVVVFLAGYETGLIIAQLRGNANRAREAIIFNYVHHFTLRSPIFLIYFGLFGLRKFNAGATATFDSFR